MFPHIDTDSDGKISAEEYRTFQKFKAEHSEWEETLRKNGDRKPGEKRATGLRPA